MFAATSITNEAGDTDYPCYWSSTTHANWSEAPCAWVAQLAFRRAMAYMKGSWMGVHGAGAQRSDPKTGDPGDWPEGHGPQGDAVRIYNYVRCVRDWVTEVELTGSFGEQTLELTWVVVSGTIAHWVCGAENEAFFAPGLAPGYAHRLAILPGSTTT